MGDLKPGTMSDTGQSTNSILRICGSTGFDNEVSAAEASSSWLGALARLLRCHGRRDKWQRPSRGIAVASEALEMRKTQELDFSWLTTNATSKVFKVLLVFPRNDQQFEILVIAARKLGWSVSEAKNAEQAAELFRLSRHDLAIVDRRGTSHSQNADEICSILTNLRIYPFACNIIALVKKTFFTITRNDEEGMLFLLNIGYSRALMECSHMGILMNELIGIYTSEIQPKSQLAAAQLLYLFVDTSRDIVHVTNDQHIVQFVNRATEVFLGFKQEELVGKRIEDFMIFENLALMQQHLRRGKEFQDNIVWKRKDRTPLNINCSVVPISVPVSQTVYYIYRCDITSKQETISSSVSFHNFTGQESHSNGRYSFESKTLHEPRKSTVTKLHNLLLDSPITKVIKLLSSAGEGSVDPDVSEKIKAAIRILLNTELYTPQLREDDPLPISDPIISELLESLISVSVNFNDSQKVNSSTTQKRSPVKNANATEHQTNTKLFKNPRDPEELEELLENNFDWDLDIFKLEILTNRRPLYFLGTMMMNHYKVAEKLNCDEKTLQNWLTIIEANYNIHVSYHNSTHATDVLQAIACFLRSNKLQMILEPLHEVAALLAAIAHDIGHPGKSSPFLCNANSKLAILYNDLSVLESHHSALTFKITLSDDNVNIFKNLNRDVYKSIRQNIIDMILATEMTKHFEHFAKFVNVCSNRINDKYEVLTNNISFAEDVTDMSVFLLPENVSLTMRMMIKCADVSNPTRPLRFYVEWTRRIAEEYFDQTDEEKKKMMPVMMPMFDRACCSIPKLQIGFIDYIINDMMEAWDAFIDMPQIIGYMRENYEKWKEFHEQGITTLEDIKKLQLTPELQIYTK
ncbi:PREDICTED: high affinity cAMP-specific and IBMX-insensitive 3',5'-cyclic phosphodiesterase 8A-like [Ceratosolen solmsi marchali]|uniref:3',5'-cyclic-AMP phosphodiesterase n=1 Tax=Ceratosolen solmsi marchali TaxID=326594 RepID=A0AAJ6YCQ2_9HYME|nr:PREDICTED: high affinity cAMP-specific and IBMX-insensitive 3',5'-cyclic phosphodiesterase 8A-like [Ceratosolen solmsi marchali]